MICFQFNFDILISNAFQSNNPFKVNACLKQKTMV